MMFFFFYYGWKFDKKTLSFVYFYMCNFCISRSKKVLNNKCAINVMCTCSTFSSKNYFSELLDLEI